MALVNFHDLLITAVVLLLLLPSAAPDIASDRASLIALRSALRGRALFWDLSNASPCSWTGVICSRDNSSVVELRLPGMGLSGQVPPNTISNLTKLHTLSLRYNSLSGPLPADLFSSIASLRNLYMQNNFFTGEIPDSLFSVSTLVRVNFANNSLSGPISPSFKNLTRLGTLYLQNNHFSGSIPDLDSPTLVQFDVSNNNLTGRVPKGLSGMSKASFAGNSLCGAPMDACAGEETPKTGEGNEKPKKKRLSGGAIAGIVIGSVIAFVVILLLIFCLCRKKAASRDDGGSKEKEVEVPGGNDGGRSVAAVGEKGREKGEGSMMIGGKKGLVFFGKTGWTFDLEDLLRASAEVLGKGTFGTAYKAALESGLAVAVKRLRELNMGEKEFRAKMEEIGRMDHQNLVPLRAYYFNRDEKLLVFDYLPLGSLSALLHGNNGGGRTPFNWDTRALIALGAARGIAYLHSQGSSIAHGNIKSSNILLTKTYEARVSDFGLAQLAGPSAAPNRVAGYRAPEVTDSHKVSQKADVYSFGVLLLELLTGKAPAHSLMNDEGVDLPRWVQSVVRDEWTAEVFDIELLRYQNVEEDMVQLLQLAVECTAPSPDKRPSMAEAAAKIEELCRRSLKDPTADDDIVDGGAE